MSGLNIPLYSIMIFNAWVLRAGWNVPSNADVQAVFANRYLPSIRHTHSFKLTLLLIVLANWGSWSRMSSVLSYLFNAWLRLLSRMPGRFCWELIGNSLFVTTAGANWQGLWGWAPFGVASVGKRRFKFLYLLLIFLDLLVIFRVSSFLRTSFNSLNRCSGQNFLLQFRS